MTVLNQLKTQTRGQSGKQRISFHGLATVDNAWRCNRYLMHRLYLAFDYGTQCQINFLISLKAFSDSFLKINGQTWEINS